MMTSLTRQARAWVLCLCFACCVEAPAAQLVELTAEIEVDDWSYWFWADRGKLPGPASKRDSIFRQGERLPMRCVVGTNTWMMEGDFASNARVTWSFTGTNIMERVEITKVLPEAEAKRISQIGRLATTSPPVGSVTTRVTESSDGNPGRPVRVADLMGTGEKVCWLAFCSAPVIRGTNRQIPLPGDLWKEFFPASAKFTNDVRLFEDGLGLPETIDVSTATGQLVLQYQAHLSTNVLGWSFPTEFYFVQYKPASWPRTNSWEVHLTGKGRVTSIGPGKGRR